MTRPGQTGLGGAGLGIFWGRMDEMIEELGLSDAQRVMGG